VTKRKLIEVALPLEAINRESAREKSIRHGHPSTLHLWWARRPLAAARAVLFAQLVDDPSSHPDKFPTEEAQRIERERLHNIIERLVVWENIRDEKLFAEAKAEIWASCDGNPPPILDPFAGGGTIPLEAQRLGLEAHASDLNPVAVLINKALIEIPPKFRDQRPVFPGLADSEIRTWMGAEGLGADVRAYGQWMRDEAEMRIGHLYPKASLPDGSSATVIAWIWARTVTCPNPACGIELPLVASWWLGKKKGREAYVVPAVVPDRAHPSGKRVQFAIGNDARGPREDGTMSGRTGAMCIACGGVVPVDHIRQEWKAGRRGQVLLSVVADGDRRRVYLAPEVRHVAAAEVSAPPDSVDGDIAVNPRWFSPPAYGLTRFADLFTNRQLVALTTFSDLVAEVREQALKDALAAGLVSSERLDHGGLGADAYADAVGLYLGLAVCNVTDDMSSIVTWRSSHGTGATRATFARQALPMTWDFAEVNPFSRSSGDLATALPGLSAVLERLPRSTPGLVGQFDARVAVAKSNAVLSTDPPYYDNIGYSDLSDYFYVWQRRTLRDILPSLLNTLLVPKAEELVANPYRHGGTEQARQFFEQGFQDVFARARECATTEFPMTVYYAFKQSESDAAGVASTGWETLLDGMIRSGWAIQATWPMRSEKAGRMLSVGTNALASSIVLALRPRPANAPTTDRRGLIEALHVELPNALRNLQQGQIAPVDLPQAAIGPGMAVFSRYAKVVEADGTAMSVRSALARINEILDQVLAEQEGDFDAVSRFAIAWYRQNGYGIGTFGTANDLARARNTSVDLMDRHGILTSRANKVALIKPADLPAYYDPVADPHTSNWEGLHHLIRVLESDGIGAAGTFLAAATSRPDGAIEADLAKELAFLLFSIAEKNGWTKDALSFNALAQSWPDIVAASRNAGAKPAPQGSLDFDADED
jgi:putative DNA methylase